MIVVVSYYPERRAALPNNWTVWETTKPIPETYANIARHAVAEGWDRDVVVVQDDVRFDALPDCDADLIVYGQGDDAHVCPRAFAAAPHIWRQLGTRWQSWTGQVCLTWKPLVAEHGAILNVTTHG